MTVSEVEGEEAEVEGEEAEVGGEEAEVEGGKGELGRPVGRLDKRKRKDRRCGDCMRAGREAGAAECEGKAGRIKCPLGECPKAPK